MSRENFLRAFGRLKDGGGFTLELDGTPYEPDRGFAVASGPDYADESAALDAARPGQKVGFWRGDRDYINLIDVYDSEAAAAVAAFASGQTAFYDFASDAVRRTASYFITRDHGEQREDSQALTAPHRDEPDAGGQAA